jgi:transcription initiation factor IIE alpha subunit
MSASNTIESSTQWQRYSNYDSTYTAGNEDNNNTYFAICNSCHWCTSLLDSTQLSLVSEKCPSCKSQLMSLMPIELVAEHYYSFHTGEASAIRSKFSGLAGDEKE